MGRMAEKGTGQPEAVQKAMHRRVHMANERTFLAWIRTSIGLMAFGFVVERFALFMKQLSYYSEKLGVPLKKSGNAPVTAAILHPQSGYSFALGIFLVGLGTLLAALAFVKYKRTQKQIEEDSYEPSVSLDVIMTAAVLAAGLFLLVYLVRSSGAFIS